jgi:hypothetical protein
MTEVPTMSNVPSPPYDIGDDEPEFRPRPRRRAHALTFVLAGLLLIGAGFYGGVLVQKHQDHGTTASTTGTGRGRAFAAGAASGATGATGASGASGAVGGGFGGRGFGGGGGAVTGTVKLVDGRNVYVTDAGGNVVKIETGASSTLTKTDPATTRDVAPGNVVIARGTQNSDGSYTASSLVISSATALTG